MSSRLALAALALVVLVCGCGGGDDRREAVGDYIDDANAIQRELLAPLGAARRAYADFTRRDADLEQVRPRLTKATRTVETLERRLARLKPPADARRLHTFLLALVEGQAALAHEVELLAAFLPTFQQRLASLHSVERRLRTGLAEARTPDAQAAAIARYVRDVRTVRRTMSGLHPPEAMAPAYETQVETLTNVERGAAALARALKEKDAKVLPTRLRQFVDAARGSRSLASQRANIAAVKAYNRRIAALAKLAERVNLERLRLQKTLG